MQAASPWCRRGGPWRNTLNVGLLLLTGSRRWGAEASDPARTGVYSPYMVTPDHHAVIDVQVRNPVLLNFTCETAGLADAQLTLNTDGSNFEYFVSVNRLKPGPDTSIGSSGESKTIVLQAAGVRPWGGYLGVNVLGPATHGAPAHITVYLSCSYVVALDPLFGGEVHTGRVCPTNVPVSDAEPLRVCSGHGQCQRGGFCRCEPNFASTSNCASPSEDRSSHNDKGARGHKAIASQGAGLIGLLALIIATACTCVVCYKTCKKRYVRDGDMYGDDAEEDTLAFFGFPQYQGLAHAAGHDDGLTPLSRSNSFLHFAAGYMDHRAEDRYLRRGGFADDGI
mmetsp:Transcript_21868/g.40228  ORF Transcript_21868/g.40228 Transcript_21868/m.40228 type:complete len:338 (+) Transcript_21868:92-1105(+)